MKDSIIEKFRSEIEKQNPWQPYRGDAGGEGWQNMVTGEVRYQDERPGAEEGMPEDHEGEIPDMPGEPEVDPEAEEIDIAPEDVFEEGDEITFEDLDSGEELDAEIVGNIDSETGPIIEDENGDQYQAMWEEIQEDPLEEYYAAEPGLPTPADIEDLEEGDEVIVEWKGEESLGVVTSFEEGDGLSAAMIQMQEGPGEGGGVAVGPYADKHDWDSELIGLAPEGVDSEEEMPDGWGENWAEPPDDHDDLFPDQEIEIYDIAEGQYKQGEVQTIQDWAEGTYVSVSTEDGDVYEWVGGEASGASENALMTAAEDMVIPEVEGLQPGDFDHDLLGEERAVFNEESGEIVQGEIVDVAPDYNEIKLEGEDGLEHLVTPGTQNALVTEEGLDQIKLHEAEKVEAEDLLPDEPADMSLHQGALAEIEHPAEGTITGDVRIVDHGDQGRHMYVGDSEVGIPLDDPDHPLAQIEVNEIESQWYDVEEEEEEESGIMGELNDEFGVGDAPVELGDEVFYGGETYTVTGVDPHTGEVEIDNETTWSAAEARSFAEYKKPVDMPDEPYDENWDYSLPNSLKEEDTVVVLGDDGTLTADKVQEDTGGQIETFNHGVVDEEQIRAWADTGKPAPNQMDPVDVTSGSKVTLARPGPDGSIDEFEVYVTDVNNAYSGATTISGLNADGEAEHYEIDERKYGVRDQDRFADAGDVVDSHGGWETTDATEMADEFYESVVPNHQGGSYLDKRISLGERGPLPEFFKQYQEDIRTQMMTYFSPGQVEDFYDAISAWKTSSTRDSQDKKMLEEAFRRAMDSESRVGQEHEERPEGPSPPREWEKMAEVANEMSQRYYEDVVKPNTGGRLTRDASSTSFRSFLLEWAENPDADEMGLDGRALNNFQIDPGTWNYWRVTPQEVEAEDIGLMTDMMFNPMQTNSKEDEIWVNPDDLTFSPENTGVGKGRTSFDHEGHFGGDIENWSRRQVELIGEEIAQHYGNLTLDENEVYRPDDLSDQQIETFLQVADRIEDEDLTTSGLQSWADTVRAEAVNRGLESPEGSDDHPIIETAEQIPEGTEVTMRDELGDTFPGLVIGAENGQLEVENADTGKVGTFDIDSIDEIEWASERYGKPAEVDMSDYGAEDFEPLDEVYAWSGGDWVEGKITEADDGSVRVSLDDEYGTKELFDESMIQQENYVVPQDMVGDDGDDGPDYKVQTDDPGTNDYVVAETMYDSDPVVAQVDEEYPSGEVEIIPVEGESAQYNSYSVDPDEALVDPDEYDGPVDIGTGDGTLATGDYVEVSVPEYAPHDAESVIAQVEEVDPDGSINVSYDDIPWKDQPQGDAFAETIEIGEEGYTPTEKPESVQAVEDYDGDFDAGQTVQLDPEHDFPGGSVTIGDRVGLMDGAEGTVVDVTEGYDPIVHIESDGGDPIHDVGDTITAYPSDDVYPIEEADDETFGAITDGFDSTDMASAYEGDVVEYVDPDTGELQEAEMEGVAWADDAVTIEGVSDTVPIEHVRPSHPVEPMYSHDSIELGSEIVGEFADSVMTGTVIGFDENKQQYIVDGSAPGEKPAPSEVMYQGISQIEDVKGENEVNEEAVQMISGHQDGFTQDLPGDEANDTEEPDEGLPSIGETEIVVGTPSYNEIQAGDLVEVQGDIYEVEVEASGPSDFFRIEDDQGSVHEVQDWEIDAVVEAEGSDDLQPGDTITYESYGSEHDVEVVDPDPAEGYAVVDTGETNTTIYEDEVVDAGETEGPDEEAEGSDPEPETDPTDLTEYEVVPDISPDELEDHKGEWIHFMPDSDQYENGIVGRLVEVSDVLPGGSFSAEDIQSVSENDFPMSEYSGDVDEVSAIRGADGSDEVEA